MTLLPSLVLGVEDAEAVLARAPGHDVGLEGAHPDRGLHPEVAPLAVLEPLHLELEVVGALVGAGEVHPLHRPGQHR